VNSDITERKRAKERNALLEGQLNHSQKMEAIGQLAGGVAHDFNNMLSGIMGYASLLHMNLGPDDPRTEDTEEILTICKNARNLTRNLLGFARKGKYCKERINLNETISGVRDLLLRTIPKKICVEFQTTAGRQPQIEGDRSQLEQIMMNLCINAADAMGQEGTLTLSTREIVLREVPSGTNLTPGRHVEVSIIDTGTGMDQEILDKAFEPFFTTKVMGEGTGLGLSMVYGTVQNHGGTVTLKSKPGQGTTVTLLFPVPSPTSDVIPESTKPVLTMGKGTILVVDDDERVRASTARLLQRMGYQPLQAQDGSEALRVYRERAGEIDLVLLDMAMPVLDGTETFHQLKELDPQVRTLLFSGYSADTSANALLAQGANGFIQKPYTMAKLSWAVAQALIS
ncbi:MAG: response regulator, partial [Proteobacteria bacterium]|nr:response regulator [Pseudomonadota bacterium]